MLELHEFELPWNDVQVRNVGAADDLWHFPAVGVVANGAVDRFILADIKLGLMPEECREASLRIEVDWEDPVAAERKRLKEMCGRCGFAAAALEVHYGDDLQRLGVAPLWDISAGAFTSAVEVTAQRVDVFDRIAPTAVGWRGGPLPFRYELPKIALSDADKARGFRRRKAAYGLLGRGRKVAKLVRTQPRR